MLRPDALETVLVLAPITSMNVANVAVLNDVLLAKRDVTHVGVI